MSSFFALPGPIIGMRIYAIVHGFILDVFLIGVLPFLSEEKSDAERLDKFPWALGGYSPSYPKVPNLAPTHRRFMTENLAYALLRFSLFFFYTNVPVLLMAVLSYVVEAMTIAWEQLCYEAPPNSMLPQTLMAAFSTGVTYVAYANPGSLISEIDPIHLQIMQASVVFNWLLWLVCAGKQATKKKSE